MDTIKARLTARGHDDAHDDLFSVLLRRVASMTEKDEEVERLAAEMRDNRVRRIASERALADEPNDR